MARLAVLVPDMRGGGAERVVLTLIEGFLEKGHDVDLLLLEPEGKLMGLLPAPVRVIELEAKRMRHAVGPVAKYLREKSPEAMLAVMWPMPVIAIMARRIAGTRTRIVTSDHGILSDHYRGRPSTLVVLWLTTKLFYPLADRRVAASKRIASDLADISGHPDLPIQVIPNPIARPPSPIAGRQEAEKLWRGPGQRILSVGALKDEKNHALLIRAFAELSRSMPAQLLILGEGPLRGELEKLADKLGIADRVAMPGFHADPWPFYASANLLVLSSSTEGFGNVLVEAMAVGLPVVSTDCGGPSELLGEGAFGELVPVNDAVALCRAMENGLSTKVDRKRLRQRAERYSPEYAIDAYLAALVPRNLDM